MPNPYFQFKQFMVRQDKCAMKVTTDGCLFGAWAAEEMSGLEFRVGGSGIDSPKVLDIGAGTGLLSLMLAQKNPSAEIDAIEIEEAAAKQAQENADESPWKGRVNIICADAKEFLFGKKYDIIISNPPFYENELKSDNKGRNTAHHNEGLLLSELSELIKENLLPEGHFYLLLPYKRENEIRKLLLQQFDIIQMMLVKQSPQHDYFRIMLEGKLKLENNTETKISEIAITDERKEYTETFIRLLNDYYLHL